MTQTTVNESIHHPSFVESRINTAPLLESIELYLKGKQKQTVQLENGMVVTQLVQVGRPLANEIGINNILSSIQMRINTHTVQGNFDNERYEDYKYHTRREIASDLVRNSPDWGVRDGDLLKIINDIMGLLIPFMTRLLQNKERESYGAQIQSREIINTEKGMNFNPFSKSGG